MATNRSPGQTERQHWRITLWLLVVALMLSGCGDGAAEQRLLDYQQQLAAALQRPAPDTQPPPNIGDFPERQARRFTLPDIREGLTDIYALRGCRISNLVAQRNNQLGKVAAPSQRWLYELELWRRLESCRTSEIPATLDEEDRQRLERLTRLKTERLPEASWNALFDSSEWVDSFSRASSPLAPDELSAVDRQLPALAYLQEAAQHQLDPEWTTDSATLEGHLNTLRQRPLTAELLRALLLAEQRLKEASALLTQRLAATAQCRKQPLPDIAPLNQWLDRLDQQATRWLTAIQALINAHPVTPPPAIAEYRRRWLSPDNPQAPLRRLQTVRQTHQMLRQGVIARCP